MFAAAFSAVILTFQKGCYVHGLFLEGARWSLKNRCLEKSLPKVLVKPLPILSIEPIEAHRLKLQVSAFSREKKFTLKNLEEDVKGGSEIDTEALAVVECDASFSSRFFFRYKKSKAKSFPVSIFSVKNEKKIIFRFKEGHKKRRDQMEMLMGISMIKSRRRDRFVLKNGVK